MDSIRIIEGQARYVVAAVVLLIATLAAALVPAIVSAAQITERSIVLSNSSKEMEDVTYTVNFTAKANAGAVVVDFCSNTPLIGQACTAPAGFDATAVTSSTSGVTAVNDLAANTVVVETAIDASQNSGAVTFALEGITNPTAAEPIYARILTYALVTEANSYVANTANPDASNTDIIDHGSVAIAITDTVGVAGAVLEALSFCVSGVDALLANCANADDKPPTLRLGEEVSTDVYALQSNAVSTGAIATQISTNAVGGAIVRLKSSAANCGGLVRAGAPTSCDITPATSPLTAATMAGTAKFGVRVAPSADPTDATTGVVGAFGVASGSSYDGTNYFLNFTSGASPATGVTSAYGDPILDTAGAPANNKNATLTFGASVSNSTPAGLYSTDLSLVATGRF